MLFSHAFLQVWKFISFYCLSRSHLGKSESSMVQKSLPRALLLGASHFTREGQPPIQIYSKHETCSTSLPIFWGHAKSMLQPDKGFTPKASLDSTTPLLHFGTSTYIMVGSCPQDARRRPSTGRVTWHINDRCILYIYIGLCIFFSAFAFYWFICRFLFTTKWPSACSWKALTDLDWYRYRYASIKICIAPAKLYHLFMTTARFTKCLWVPPCSRLCFGHERIRFQERLATLLANRKVGLPPSWQNVKQRWMLNLMAMEKSMNETTILQRFQHPTC